MAIFKMPFMHKLTQSMAENTYVRSKGKNIVKTKIDSNRSKTLKQQIQRLKMKETIALCKIFNAAIHTGFPERPVGFSEWNAFTRANLPAVSVSDELEVSVDYEAILVAQGSLEPVKDVRIVKDAETHSLTVSHSSSTYGYGTNKDDMLYAVVLERKQMYSEIHPLNERQDEKPATVALPDSWEMENLAVYVFALSANGRKASNSVFVPLN